MRIFRITYGLPALFVHMVNCPNRRQHRRYFYSILALGFLPGSAIAESPDNTGVKTGHLEEIIVTGSFKESPLMKTPMTMTAIEGTDLANHSVDSLGEIRFMAPGVSFVDAGESNTRIVIRGIQGTGEATAGLYYNDVAMSGVVGATNDAGGTTPSLRLIDVDRVEILRGPQGTLYGAGAMSGAVKVFFNQPGYQQETRVQLAVSDTKDGDNNYDVSLINNTPLFDSKLLTRIVLYGEDHGGYIDNTFYDDSNINENETHGARLSLSGDLSDKVKLTGTWLYQKQEGDRPLWYLEEGAYHSVNRVAVENLDRIRLASLNLEYLLDDAQFTAIASHLDREADQVSLDTSEFYESFIDNVAACEQVITDFPCTIPAVMDSFNGIVSSFFPGALYPHQSATQDTLEIRYATEHVNTLNLTTGLYYSERDSTLDNYEFGADSETGEFLQPRDIQYYRQVEESLEQTALFAELSYPFTSRFNATIGTRYFEYEKFTSGQTTVSHPVLSPEEIPYQEFNSDESGWISRVLLDYQATESLLTYFSVAEGYRPGGVNQAIDLPDNLQSYDADTLINYEVGAKTKLLDEALFLAVSLYQTHWDDIQITGVRNQFRFTANANKAQVNGAEFEISLQASDALKIAGQLAWTDARLTEDQNNEGLEDLGITGLSGEDGDPVPYVPDFTASTQLEYEFWQTNSVLWTGYFNYSYVDSSVSEFNKDNPYYRELPSYELINLQVTAGFQGELNASLFVDNLLDETAITYAQADQTSLGKAWVASLPPRTIGISVSKAFF